MLFLSAVISEVKRVKGRITREDVQDDYEELDAFYWSLLADLIFEGAYNENR